MKTSERSSYHMGFKKNIIDLLESYQYKIICSIDKEDDNGFRDAKEGAEIVVKHIIGEDNIIAMKRGRFYNRYKVAKILAKLWEKSTRDVDFWKQLIGDMEDLHTSIRRNDVDQCIYPLFIILSNSADAANKHRNDTVTPLPQQTCEVNEELSKTEFMEKYIDQCRAQKYDSMVDFKQFQTSFTEALRAWESKLSKPTLVQLQYGDQPGGASRLPEGNIEDKRSNIKAQELQQATKRLSKAQRNGPDPTSIAEAIANKAIPDRNVAWRTDEASSLPDVECTMKKRKASDATNFSFATDDDTRARPIRRRIPTNFFHHEFSQKDSEQSESVDILITITESDEVRSPRRQNTGIGDSTHDANTSGTKMNASPGEKIAYNKPDAGREEANNRMSGSPDKQPNETRVTEFFTSKFSPSKHLNFTEEQVEIQSAPIMNPKEEKLSRCHGILAPAVCNNNNAPNKSPPQKKANKSLNKSLWSGQLEEAEGTVIMMNRGPGELSITGHPHPEHTDNNQENQEVLATTQAGTIESKETARERKKRETTITFDDSDASVSSPIEFPRDHADTTNTRQTAVDASNHLHENMKRIIGRKKRSFTLEEKNALRLGIKKFGIGKWSLIKSEYSDIFRYRTAVQIKDLYRTMAKNSIL